MFGKKRFPNVIRCLRCRIRHWLDPVLLLYFGGTDSESFDDERSLWRKRKQTKTVVGSHNRFERTPKRRLQVCDQGLIVIRKTVVRRTTKKRFRVKNTLREYCFSRAYHGTPAASYLSRKEPTEKRTRNFSKTVIVDDENSGVYLKVKRQSAQSIGENRPEPKKLSFP